MKQLPLTIPSLKSPHCIFSELWLFLARFQSVLSRLKRRGRGAVRCDRMLIAIGVWSLPDPGARSGACFDALSFEAQSTPPPPLTIDQQAIAPIDKRMFQPNLFMVI
jgi:hypothetical protein